MPLARRKRLPALIASGIMVLGLLAASVAEAQWAPPPPPPPRCPPGYHWEGERGCWPNGPGIRPLCPPGLAWRHGECHRMQPPPDGPHGPPPPPHY
jgi:hypothetical protein